MKNDKKKSVLITGANGLIGTALCEKFLTENYLVYAFVHHTQSKLKHPSLKIIKCDLASEKEIKKALTMVSGLDVLINNAAATDLTFKKFEDVSLKDWNEGMAVNLTSIFLLTKFLTDKLKTSSGSIINISSTRHLMSEPDTVIYSATKGAIVALTHSLAVTLGPKIRVNCISPGWIAAEDEKLKKRDHDQHPAGRVGTPDDVAELALFLASAEKAGFITGADFIVDGGMTRKMIYS